MAKLSVSVVFCFQEFVFHECNAKLHLLPVRDMLHCSLLACKLPFNLSVTFTFFCFSRSCFFLSSIYCVFQRSKKAAAPLLKPVKSRAGSTPVAASVRFCFRLVLCSLQRVVCPCTLTGCNTLHFHYDELLFMCHVLLADSGSLFIFFHLLNKCVSTAHRLKLDNSFIP